MKKICTFLFLFACSITIYAQRIPSISDLLSLKSMEKVKTYALKHGYEDNEDLTGYEKPGIVDITTETNASETVLYGLTVTVYSKKDALTWINQLKQLGYKTGAGGGEGARGRNWSYSKKGSPGIGLWNDYGNTYELYIVFIKRPNNY